MALTDHTAGAVAAICELQAQIQVATCFSCHGHGRQAMVLEPYASMPCLRCHGEGVTHDVPPGRYGAVLAALLDALGGAPAEQVAGRLGPAVTAPGEAEPSVLAAHRVRIYTRKPAHVPDYHVAHPADCNEMPYGEACWFDSLADVAREFSDWSGWPGAGRYVADAPAEGERSIRFKLIPEEN